MHRFTVAALGVALAWIFASPSLAFDEIPFATSSRAEISDEEGAVSVALPGGGFAVLWLDISSQAWALRMQWLDENGDIVFEPGGQILVPDGVGNATLAANPAGGVFVAHGGLIGSEDGIKVQSYDAAGVAQWPGDGILASNILDAQRSSDLVADNSGGVYSCFSFRTALNIRCQRFDSAGNLLWAAEGLLPTDAAGLHVRPRVLSDGAGGLLVFWRNQSNGNNGPAATMVMQGQRFDGAGNRQWGSSGLIVADTSLPPSDSFRSDLYDLISDGASGAILAFDSLPSAGAANSGVMAQRVSVDGALLWGSGVVVVADSEVSRQDASIDPHDGGIIVATSDLVGAETKNLRLFRLNADGDHLWPEAGTLLSDPDSPGSTFAPTGSFDGGVLRMVWSYQISAADNQFFEIDIDLARFSATGQRLEPFTEIVTEAPNTQLVRTAVSSSETSQTLVVWQDRRAGIQENDVYGAILPFDTLFGDGFETGDTMAWSSTFP